LTGEQEHRNDIKNGQHQNRHADQPNVFYFFTTAHFLKTILSQPTNGTFGFARHTSRPFAKPKEPNFANRTDKTVENFLITFYLAK
jgi:hypothetical protein